MGIIRQNQDGFPQYRVQNSQLHDLLQKIFLELFTRVQANYSRAIQGQENKYTHESVKGQESLQNTEQNYDKQTRYS